MSTATLRRRRCIQGGVAPDVPGISIALSKSALSAAQSGTDSHLVTLTRLGGYTGTVTIAASGLPTGVTASYSDATLSGGDTVCTITYTFAADAPTVSLDAIVVSATGTGVSDSLNATVTVTAPSGGATPFFSDDFETGGFGGAGIAADTPGQVNYYNAGNESSNSVVGGSLMGGTYCHRTRYIADTAGYDPERRMNLDRNIGPEFALEFDFLVPTNFAMRGTGQTKFFQAWQDTYGGENPGFQVGAEIWRISDTEAYFRPMGTIPNVAEMYGGGRPVYGLDDFGATFPQSYGNRFISPDGPVVPGVKVQIRIAVKQASTQFATDGTYRMWVNGVLHTTYTGSLHERNVAGAFGSAFLRFMYFMGESNPGFLEQTDFHMDDLLWYDAFPDWAL